MHPGSCSDSQLHVYVPRESTDQLGSSSQGAGGDGGGGNIGGADGSAHIPTDVRDRLRSPVPSDDDVRSCGLARGMEGSLFGSEPSRPPMSEDRPITPNVRDMKDDETTIMVTTRIVIMSMRGRPQ